jgi:hypothetical protein
MIDVLIVCALQDEYRELIKVTSDIIAPGSLKRVFMVLMAHRFIYSLRSAATWDESTLWRWSINF